MDGRNLAPPKTPWKDDSPLYYQQIMISTMVAKWCERIWSIHSISSPKVPSIGIMFFFFHQGSLPGWVIPSTLKPPGLTTNLKSKSPRPRGALQAHLLLLGTTGRGQCRASASACSAVPPTNRRELTHVRGPFKGKMEPKPGPPESNVRFWVLIDELVEGIIRGKPL